jgi:ketosteroid isomerase-like protein
MEEARRDAGVKDDRERIDEIDAALAAGDVEAFAQLMHPEVVWEHNLGRGSPEEGVYEGRDSMARLLERILEPWEYIRTHPHDVSRLEDGSYLVQGELRSKHAISDAEVVTPYEQRLEFRDGLLAKGSMTLGETG